MLLSSQQQKFARLVGQLLVWANAQGYEITFGETFRTPEQAQWNAAKGKGIANSLHCQRLAIDLNLFRNGQYLTHDDEYRPLGEFWKSLDPDCRWGGDWKKSDADHFSLTWGGVE